MNQYMKYMIVSIVKKRLPDKNDKNGLKRTVH